MEKVSTKEENTELSLLSNIPENKIDPIMTIMEKYRLCEDKNKINLTVGAYRDDNLKNYVFKTVSKAEADILALTNKNRAYPAPTGDEEFNTECRRLFFKDDSEVVLQNRIVSSQSFSGSGALSLIARFLSKYLKIKNPKIYIPEPTWSNHDLGFEQAGFKVIKYEYFSMETMDLNFDNITKIINESEEGTLLLLHSCAYNPTGCDLSKDQWERISDCISKKKVFTILDTAYQGFASGDIEEDSYAIKLFNSKNIEFAICQSFSKNMGLYGERAGCLHVVFNDLGCKEKNYEMSKRIKFGLAETALTTHLIPLCHGSEIIKRVLKNYFSEWQAELKEAVGRIIRMRQLLYDEMKKINCPGSWDHILKQKGMFAYTGLNEKQCDFLIDVKKIYLVRTGRISICGINKENAPFIAQSMKEAVELK